jgi:hypothetical protein
MEDQFSRIDPSERIGEAARILNSITGTAKTRLVVGGTELWAAMIDNQRWSPDMRQKAWHICEALLNRGTIKTTVETMDQGTAETVARRVAREMAELAADMQRAKTSPGAGQ